MITARRLVKDRTKAFRDALHKDDTASIVKYCRKYMIPMPTKKEVMLAGVYKVIQECPEFTDEEKEIAREKCIKLGFKPYLK